MKIKNIFLKVILQSSIHCLGLMFLFFVSACGSSEKKQNLVDDYDYIKRAVPVKQAELLPAEILNDIEQITEDGRLVYVEDSSEVEALVNKANDPSLDAKNSEDKSENGVQKSSGNKIQGVAGENNLNQNINGEDQNDNVVQEDDLVIQDEQGPLAKSLRDKNLGPLSFNAQTLSSNLPPLKGGKTIRYIVKLGDTLMEIAFEKYGNYLRWKDVFQINKHKMKSPERMQVGTELTIKNVKYVYIKRDGQPYLIRKMDTLKSISNKLYGTPDRWKEIWKNNPQLIRNPKRIYAGFTLYYPSNGKAQDQLEKRNPTSEDSVRPEAKK